MSRPGLALLVSEMVGYGLSLNLGYPFDTAGAALITAAVVAGTWAVDRLVFYLQRFKGNR